MQQIQEKLKKNETKALEEFLTFLRFPSISTDPDYKKELLDCMYWLKDYIEKIGLHTEIWETPGNPILFATHLKAGPDKPTLLIYNHYDVQPVDPLELWTTPPFEPTMRDGEIYARGACDNKGQCFYVLQALKMLLERDGSLPVNIKLCIEGEEEVGSAGLAKILKSREKELKADYLAIVDVGIPAADRPAIVLGTRGIVTFTLDLEGSNSDLHSGSHGGVVINPLHAAVSLLASLRDSEGRITIPGFYDDVLELSPEDLAEVSFEFDPKVYQTTFGASSLGGEKTYSPLQRAGIRPTIEINGIAGGYGGAGFKTVIPAKTVVKLSCRLVPNQEPEKIGKLVADYLKKNVCEGIKLDVSVHPGKGSAVRTSSQSHAVKAFAKAYQDVFHKKCEYTFEGGSIPIATELAKASGSEVVFVGLGLPGDKVHAPNEHFGWDRVEKGALVIARALELLGE